MLVVQSLPITFGAHTEVENQASISTELERLPRFFFLGLLWDFRERSSVYSFSVHFAPSIRPLTAVGLLNCKVLLIGIIIIKEHRSLTSHEHLCGV